MGEKREARSGVASTPYKNIQKDNSYCLWGGKWDNVSLCCIVQEEVLDYPPHSPNTHPLDLPEQVYFSPPLHPQPLARNTSLRGLCTSYSELQDSTLISFRSLSNVPCKWGPFPDNSVQKPHCHPSHFLFTTLHILLYFFLNSITTFWHTVYLLIYYLSLSTI